MISVNCSGCGKTLRVKDELTGRKGKCPGCGQAVQIPAATVPAGAAQLPVTTEEPAPPAFISLDEAADDSEPFASSPVAPSEDLSSVPLASRRPSTRTQLRSKSALGWWILAGLLGAMAVGIGVIMRNRPATPETAADGSETPEERIRNLIPLATSIPKDVLEVLAQSDVAPRLDWFDEPTVTAILVCHLVDDVGPLAFSFETLCDQPVAVIESMLTASEREWVTMISQEVITDYDCKVEEDHATGIIEYEAPNLYRGTLEFSARRVGEHWKIAEFRFPDTIARTTLGEDGRWLAQLTEPEEEPRVRNDLGRLSTMGGLEVEETESFTSKVRFLPGEWQTTIHVTEGFDSMGLPQTEEREAADDHEFYIVESELDLTDWPLEDSELFEEPCVKIVPAEIVLRTGAAEQFHPTFAAFMRDFRDDEVWAFVPSTLQEIAILPLSGEDTELPLKISSQTPGEEEPSVAVFGQINPDLTKIRIVFAFEVPTGTQSHGVAYQPE